MGSLAEETTMRKRSRGCCSCTKQDFLPEESFQGWPNYVSALKNTPARFMNRLKARSLDDTELNQVKAESQHDMKKTLNWWDIIWFGVGAVIGAGIFVLTGQEANQHAGPAVVFSFAVSGLSAMLSVLCYTEFAVHIPVAGGSFAYLRVELGDFMAFIAAGNIILEYVISGAAVARSWTSYFATLLNLEPQKLRIIAHNLSPNYNELDPIAVGVIAVICLLAIYSTKGSSLLNYISSIIHVIIIVFIIIAGLTHADVKNLSDFTPYGPHGIFQASAVLFFAYVGFDAVSTMAEETKNPAKDIPIGLIGSMAVITFFYCLMAITLCMMVPYHQIDKDAPFTMAFKQVGMNWAKYLVAIGALKGMTTVLLVSAIGQARYLTHIARTHMLPPWLAHVDEKRGTPINATIVMMVATAIIGFFTELSILANLLSISTLFIFMLVALALLVRRYYASGQTTPKHQNLLLLWLVGILGSSTSIAVCWGLNYNDWLGYAITGSIWFVSTLGLQLSVPQARAPTVWGVPFVPWLPSASIAINIFLLGSIDGDSYIRFAIWTALLMVYYLLFGLHASYDTAMKMEKSKAAVENVLESGEVEGNKPSAKSNKHGDEVKGRSENDNVRS